MINKKPIIHDPDEECKQAVIFARVSSLTQQKEGVSLDVQMEAITKYCNDKNLKIIKELNISESSTNNERKQYKEMMNFVQTCPGKVAIVVNFVDRLQRNPDDTGLLNNLRREGKIEIHFIKENLILHKNSKGMDLIFWNMYVLMAYSPIVNMIDKVKASQEHNWAAGEWQGYAPIGYMNSRRKGKSHIKIDPERAELVKRLFEEYATGNHSLSSLAQLAKDMNLCTRKEERTTPLTRNAIWTILKNPFYYGMMRVKGQLMPHVHGALIDKVLFDDVQNVIAGKGRPVFRVGYKEEPYIFRGLIKCGTCGRTITPETQKKTLIYLRCNHPKGTCTQGLVREETILQQLDYEIFSNCISMPEEMIIALKANVRAFLANEANLNATALKTIRTQISVLKDKKDRLFDFYLDGKCDQATHDSKAAKLDKEIADLENRAEKYIAMSGDFDKAVEDIIDIAGNLKNLMESSCIAKKREILKLLLTNIRLDGQKLVYTIAPPFDTLLKTRDCKGWLGNLDSNQD